MHKWFGIRHVRWAWHSFWLARHAAFWAQYGYYVNPSDVRALQMIWDGEL